MAYTFSKALQDLGYLSPNLLRSRHRSDAYWQIKYQAYMNLENGFPLNLCSQLHRLKSGSKHFPISIGKDYWSNQFCVIPLLFCNYAVYLELKKAFGLLMTERVGNVFFPLAMKQHNTFEEHLKSLVGFKSRGLFFGEKSKVVQWDVPLDAEGIEHSSVVDFYLEHEENYVQNFGGTLASFGRPWYGFIGENKLVVAKDLVENRIVSAMTCSPIEGIIDCGTIAASKQHKYRPYSLLTAAHLACIKFAYYERRFSAISHINLGINFDDCASYKDPFTNMKDPMMNFPMQDTPEKVVDWLKSAGIYDTEMQGD